MEARILFKPGYNVAVLQLWIAGQKMGLVYLAALEKEERSWISLRSPTGASFGENWASGGLCPSL
jgi:hypothetical protein